MSRSTLPAGESPDMPSCGLTKKELRTRLKTNLGALSPEQIRTRSIQACDLFTTQPEYTRAEIIMVFLSLHNEINTTRLVLRAWQDRKRVLAPRVTWEQRRMIPVEIQSLTEDIEETHWNLRQPAQGDPVPLSMIDVVTVPGLGFDTLGNRLGRGRGFYDRFLGNPNFTGTICALGFEQQVVDFIPADPHDIKVDVLVTDQQVRRFD